MAGGPTIIWIDGLVGAVPEPDEGVVGKMIAHSKPSRDAIKREAEAIGGRARTNLATMPASRRGEYESTENFSIEVRHNPVSRGRVGYRLDSSVHLVSQRGRVAAAALEFGHTGRGMAGRYQQARRYRGLAILRRAARI